METNFKDDPPLDKIGGNPNMRNYANKILRDLFSRKQLQDIGRLQHKTKK